MKTKTQKKSGFTLVELMVVAIIVAILAAVAIPLMSGNKRRAAATEAQAAISTIWTQQRAYYAEHDEYLTCAEGSIDDLPGINDDDLNGKYFDHESYSADVSDDTLTLETSGGNGTDGIDGTVSLAIDTTDNSSEWGGSLLE